jgi:hypothetical protein
MLHLSTTNNIVYFTHYPNYDSYKLRKEKSEMTKEVTTVKQTSMTNVDISPVITEVIEYAKDQATTTDIANLIASVPKTNSMDWKLVSGVIMNSLVEWVVENKDNNDVKSLELITHLQRDVGYLLKRLGLAQ